jgi:protease I
VVNAGANVVEADVVTDGNIITCSYYSEAGRFMRHVFAAVDRMHRGETLDRPWIDRSERPSAN